MANYRGHFVTEFVVVCFHNVTTEVVRCHICSSGYMKFMLAAVTVRGGDRPLKSCAVWTIDVVLAFHARVFGMLRRINTNRGRYFRGLADFDPGVRLCSASVSTMISVWPPEPGCS